MPSATRAESRLSIAASAATASAAENSALVVAVSSTGTRGHGQLPGSGADRHDVPVQHRPRAGSRRRPRRSTPGIASRIRGSRTMRTATRATSAREGSAARQSAVAMRGQRDERGVLPLGLGHVEGQRDLLQEDDGGDADGEPLDDGPRDEGHGAAEPEQPHRQHDAARHDRDRDDGLRPVARDDRHEHDGHGAGGPGHLEVRAAEHRGHEPGHDGGDEAGGRTDPDVTPNARASGSATTPTVMPAITSARQLRLSPA